MIMTSNEFGTPGREYWFSIRAKNKKLTLNWSNVELLKKYVAKQSGAHIWKTGLNYQINAAFFFWLQWVHDDRFNAIVNSIENLDSIQKVLDIGSGASIFDLCLHQLLPKAQFTLLDKDTDTNFDEGKFVQYDDRYHHYNNWNIVNDAIVTSKLAQENFRFISPEVDHWGELDMVVSFWSWCWHYPKEVYWDKVMQNLKPGGHLILDVLYRKDKDIIEEISDAMNCKPIALKKHPTIKGHPWQDSQVDIDGFYGGLYKWVRK